MDPSIKAAAQKELLKRKAVAELERRKSMPQQTNLSDIPGQAIQNAPADAMNALTGMYEAVRHPAQTGQNMLRLANGGIANIPGVQGFNDWAESVGIASPRDKSAEQQDQELATKVGQSYKQDYGGWENIKHTLATKPVSALLDASTVLGGTGAMLKAPMLGTKAAKIGNAVTKTGNLINPTNAVTKPIGATSKLAAQLIGVSTGSGGDSIKEAFSAGSRGGSYAKSFRDNMRGHEPQDAVIGDAMNAISKIVDDRRNEYNKNMAATKANKAVLDYTPIEDAMQKLTDSLFHGPVSTTDKASLKLAKEVGESIDEWKKHYPNPTAEDLDRLKIKIDKLKPNWTQETGDQGRVIATMYNAVKNEIMAKEPTYAKTMKAYEESKAVQTEIEKALSLTKGASKDTTLRKLQSVLRNNVNTNYGSRSDNVKKLEATGAAPNIMAKLAGQSLNSVTPRGLSRIAALLMTGGGIGFSPSLLATLPLSSPRLMGEMAHLLGRSSIPGSRRAVLPAYQAGEINSRANQ